MEVQHLAAGLLPRGLVEIPRESSSGHLCRGRPWVSKGCTPARLVSSQVSEGALSLSLRNAMVASLILWLTVCVLVRSPSQALMFSSSSISSAPRYRAVSSTRAIESRGRAIAHGTRGEDEVDPLEIRLDITVLWCHCLGRELYREVTHNPPKAVPGFTPADLSALWSVAASASCLSVIWIGFGLLTKHFQTAETEAEGLLRTAATSLAAAPFWLAFESLISAPAARDEAFLPSAFGLLATMSLVRLYR